MRILTAPRRLLRRFFDLLSAASGRIGRHFFQTPMERRVAAWYQTAGYGDLRFEYDLGTDSQVFDLGGYEGQWASDIHARYGCAVQVFEPVEEFAENIRRRFARNPRITVHPLGLGSADTTVRIGLGADGSSAFREAPQVRPGRLVTAAGFLEQNGVTHIDLMKINIEGGEYDLLEHILDTGWVARIRDIQVQFHDFVPDAEARMRAIQGRLQQTHVLTYQIEFVWENWRLKSVG